MSNDKVIERYERLLRDREWPGSQEKARRAVAALVRALALTTDELGSSPEVSPSSRSGGVSGG